MDSSSFEKFNVIISCCKDILQYSATWNLLISRARFME